MTRAVPSGVSTAPDTTTGLRGTERWHEMASLVGALFVRAFGMALAAGSLLILTASALT